VASSAPGEVGEHHCSGVKLRDVSAGSGRARGVGSTTRALMTRVGGGDALLVVVFRLTPRTWKMWESDVNLTKIGKMFKI
jgi:hypothetical protein